MKNITPILQSLGLLESEVKTYMAALENGAGTAIQLSKTTGLSRQAIYDAVAALSDRGIMSSSLNGKKRFYVAEHPESLLAYAKRKQMHMQTEVEKLERLVPTLELQMGGERPIVRAFEGKESINAIMEDMKQTDFSVGYEITDVDAMYEVLTADDLKSYRMAIKQKGVEFKGLYSSKDGLREQFIPGERRILSEEDAGFQSHVDVVGDKVKMVTFAGKIHAVIIESKHIAHAMRTLMKMALQASQK